MKDPLRIAVVVPALAVIGLLMSAPLASAKTTQTQTVDCGMGQSINQALSMGDYDKPLVVTVRGTCIEAVTITRDGVTLQGDSLMGGEVKGPGDNVDVITVDGASRVAIDRLKVTNGQRGVFVRDALGVGISNTMVRQTASDGIRVLNGHARITDCTIEYAGGNGVWLIGSGSLFNNNTVRNNTLAGVRAERGSNVSAGSNQVYDNGWSGVDLTMNSQGRLFNNNISGNGKSTSGGLKNGINLWNSTAELRGGIIEKNVWGGVEMNASRLGMWDVQIKENGGNGVLAYLGTVLTIGGGSVISGSTNGHGVTFMSSMGQVQGATIESNNGFGLHLSGASTLLIYGPPTSLTANSSGGLQCADESRADGIGNLSGQTATNCTGF